MNRLVTALVFSVTSVFLSGVHACHAQTFNFVNNYYGDVTATLEVFDLPANGPSDFGEFSLTPNGPFELGPLTFNNFVGNVVLSDGELRATGGEALLFTGIGDAIYGDVVLTFFDEPDFAGRTVQFDNLTFSTTGNLVLAVPEPSSAALLMLSTLSLGIVRNRKRHI